MAIEEEEEEIDLGRVFSICVENKRLIGKVIVGCTLLAMIVSLLLPKEYTSSTVVQTSTTGKDIGGAAAALSMLTGGASSVQSPTVTYTELMKTRAVLDPIIEQVYTEKGKEKKKWPGAADFAKSTLKIENTKGTNLIIVEAKGDSPEQAHYISEGVVNNFLLLMTNLNQNSQSVLVKFLNERIAVTKQEADEAAKKLEEYSKNHKVYEPTEQTKAVLTKSSAYDKTLGEVQVQGQAAQASLEAANAQLGAENSKADSYKIMNNTAVLNVRAQIVDKEVALVKMRERYTDEHPDVIQAMNELDELHKQLDKVVADSVGVGVTTDTANAAVRTARYQAEATIAASRASEAKINELKKQTDEEIKGLADGILEYTKLKRDAEIKNQVYVKLIEQSEQAKIKQTMESMDIQIVDPADLPDIERPSGPKKKLITLGGFAVGVVISLCYAFFLYFKEERAEKAGKIKN